MRNLRVRMQIPAGAGDHEHAFIHGLIGRNKAMGSCFRGGRSLIQRILSRREEE